MRHIVTVVALMSFGCGSVLRDTAVATTITGTVLNEARRIMVEQRRAQLDACQDVACLDAVEASWRTPVEAHSAAVEAHRLLIDALVVADIAGQSGPSMATLRAALGALSSAAESLLSILSYHGVAIPPELVEAIRLITSLMRAL